MNGYPASASIQVPPLGAVFFRYDGDAVAAAEMEAVADAEEVVAEEAAQVAAE